MPIDILMKGKPSTSILSLNNPAIVRKTINHNPTIIIKSFSRWKHFKQTDGSPSPLFLNESSSSVKVTSAFVDWIVYNMNQKTDFFNGSVAVVQPIEKGMAEWLNGQDCLYHVNLQGCLNGEAVNSLTRIDCISRAHWTLFSELCAFMAFADQPEIRFVISNTTEAGIAFWPELQVQRRPCIFLSGQADPVAVPSFQDVQGGKSKAFIIMPLRIDFPERTSPERMYPPVHRTGGKTTSEQDYEKFKTWFTKYCYCMRHSGRPHVPDFPRKEIAQIQKKICYADNPGCTGRNLPPVGYRGSRESLSPPVGRGVPANKAGLNVLFVKSEAPTTKERLLCWTVPHTVLSPVAYLSGVNIVRDACKTTLLSASMSVKYSLTNWCRRTCLWTNFSKKFAADVLERFDNPYVEHHITSIMLNSSRNTSNLDPPGLKTYLGT